MANHFVARRVERIGPHCFRVRPAGFSDSFVFQYFREPRLWSLLSQNKDCWNLYWGSDRVGSFTTEEEACLYIVRFAYDMDEEPFLVPSEILATVGLVYKSLSWVDTWIKAGPAEVVRQKGYIFRPPERRIRLRGTPAPPKSLGKPASPLKPSDSSPPLTPEKAKTADLPPEGPRPLRRPISRDWLDPQNHRFRLLRRFWRQDPEGPPDAECVYTLKSDFGGQKGPKA